MSRLLEKIKKAVKEDRFVVSMHADVQMEIRGVLPWQVAAGIDLAVLHRERPGSLPSPSVILTQCLPDGAEYYVVWSWKEHLNIAKLVTVFFEGEPNEA